MAAREKALPASRRSIRCSANSIRAVHRLEFDEAERLMKESRAAIDEGLSAVEGHPSVRFAGYLQDAQKEYAEARLTEAIVRGGGVVTDVPGPDDIGVELAPYLNGMAEAIGEGRRFALDQLRRGELDSARATLETMDAWYSLLVTIDYPDAITLNLRRSTDAARAIIERTRGDVTLSVVQGRLADSLERHAKELGGS
jgi:translin